MQVYCTCSRRVSTTRSGAKDTHTQTHTQQTYHDLLNTKQSDGISVPNAALTLTLTSPPRTALPSLPLALHHSHTTSITTTNSGHGVELVIISKYLVIIIVIMKINTIITTVISPASSQSWR